jgi:hypothetical protein
MRQTLKRPPVLLEPRTHTVMKNSGQIFKSYYFDLVICTHLGFKSIKVR